MRPRMPMLRTRLLGQAFARPFLPLLVVLSLAPCVAHAAPGDLDPSFGGGGKVTTDFGVVAQASGVAVQADGKIVAAFGSRCSIEGSSSAVGLAGSVTNNTRMMLRLNGDMIFGQYRRPSARLPIL